MQCVVRLVLSESEYSSTSFCVTTDAILWMDIEMDFEVQALQDILQL